MGRKKRGDDIDLELEPEDGEPVVVSTPDSAVHAVPVVLRVFMLQLCAKYTARAAGLLGDNELNDLSTIIIDCVRDAVARYPQTQEVDAQDKKDKKKEKKEKKKDKKKKGAFDPFAGGDDDDDIDPIKAALGVVRDDRA